MIGPGAAKEARPVTARILDGKATARTIREELRAEVARLTGLGSRPGLGVVLVGDNPASAVYVRSKTRACEELGHARRDPPSSPRPPPPRRWPPPSPSTTRGATSTASWCSCPCPPQVDATRVLDLVDPAKDVDGFHPENVGRLVQKRPRFVACTPAGIMELLARHEIPVAGRRAVVVGRSDIVGKPMALLLMHADATVTVCHSRTRDLPAVCREADLLVAAMGRAGFVRAEHVKPGAVVIDVGMNRVEDPDAGAGPPPPGALRRVREERLRPRGRRARPVGARGGRGAHAGAGRGRAPHHRPPAEEHRAGRRRRGPRR